MNDKETRLREALAQIAEVAGAAVNYESPPGGGHGHVDPDGPEDSIVCTPKSLPKRLLVKAAQNAMKINPVNAPMIGAHAGLLTAGADLMNPQFAAVVTSKYWGSATRRLTVSFMESTPANLRARIVSHMNAWNRTAGISFAETSGTGQVRISRGPGGYWSYLGTDVLLIPTGRPTMNLQGFTMSTAESEYKRVVRHEAGHTLAMPHEHMRAALIARLDPPKVYDYFLRTSGWDRATVDAQVLRPLDERSIMGTPADQTSIMCYQMPGSITRDGRPIVGGADINATDYAFAGRVYPKAGHLAAADVGAEDDWPESEDVQIAA